MRADVWAKHLSIAQAGGIVLTALARHQIFPVVVKGAITAHRLYADPSERALTDLDLRVTQPELSRVRAIGREQGFTEVVFSNAYGMLSFEVAGQLVEFERFVGPPYFSSWSVSTLRNDAERHTDIFGVQHLEPRFEDHVLITALNVFKDKLFDTTRGSLEDLRRFSRHPTWNDRVILERAREQSLDLVLAAVASLFVDEPGWRLLVAAAPWSTATRTFAALYTRVAKQFPQSVALKLAMRAAGRPHLLPRAAFASVAHALGQDRTQKQQP
jgi:hypothetical protein